VDALKTKLMTHCGTSPSAMQLQLKDERGKLLADLDPGRPLGFYSPHDGYNRLHYPRVFATVQQLRQDILDMRLGPCSRMALAA
jgi:Ubiquitin-like domain